MTPSKLAEILAHRERGLPPKAIARQLGLRVAEVSSALQTSSAHRAALATTPAPLASCLLSSGWGSGLGLTNLPPAWRDLDSGSFAPAAGLVTALVAREARYGKVAVGTFLVDVFCLGVKSAAGPKTMEREELRAFERICFLRYKAAPIAAPIELVQSLVLGAADYADALGFAPDPDFAVAGALLGPWTGPSPIDFGDHGVPHFIQGPHDDSEKIVATLNRTAGEGQFRVTILM